MAFFAKKYEKKALLFKNENAFTRTLDGISTEAALACSQDADQVAEQPRSTSTSPSEKEPHHVKHNIR